MAIRGARATSVLLVGPDGTGKSTTAELLAASTTAGVRATGHYRPGLLWKRNPVPTVTPHAEPGRNTLAAALKLVAVFADFVLGYLGPWRRVGRSGVVVLERGWWDHLADPVRYRLPAGLRWFARFLAHLLPRADIVVVLGGDSAAIVSRKPELDEAEVEAQLERWTMLAPRAGRRVLTIDTVAADPQQVVSLIEKALASHATAGSATAAATGRWIKVPGTPKRNRIVATVGSRGWAALRIYRPNSLRARLLTPLRWGAVRLGLGRRWQHPDPVIDLLAQRLPQTAGIHTAGIQTARTHTAGIETAGIETAGIETARNETGGIEGAGIEGAGIEGPCGTAVMMSPGRDRAVVGLAADAGLEWVAKVGAIDDDGLRHEAAVLARLEELATELRCPDLRFAGEVDGRFVIVTGAARHVGPPVVRAEIDSLLDDLTELGLVHGDLAPWNLLRAEDGQLVVVDFEHARWGSDPGFDLCHFLVQSAALLGSGDAGSVIDDLVRTVDRPIGELVRHYAGVRRDRSDATEPEERFIDELQRELEGDLEGELEGELQRAADGTQMEAERT